MDTRIAQILAALKASGYTDRYEEEHWNGNWRDKRWFGFEDPTETILQIITGSNYIRVVVIGDSEPFTCLQYDSVDSPERPKTDFFRDRFPAATQKSLEDVLDMIRTLRATEAEEAA